MRDVQSVFPGFGVLLDEKIQRAIGVLKTWEATAIKCDPIDGYYGCFSGGKDSICIMEVARMAGVRARWHYNVTTIDPPELHRFIRRWHPDVVWERRPRHFFDMMANVKGYPLRRQRWCCEEFKEGGGSGRVRIFGVRWAESPRRRNQWKQFQKFAPKGKSADGYVVNPIVDWTDEDVWGFIRSRELPYCNLYNEGYTRLGCVGCPMSGTKGVKRDFARWPQYERRWRQAFHELWKRRVGKTIRQGRRKGQKWPGLPGITNADELFTWWISGNPAPYDGDECQLGLF